MSGLVYTKIVHTVVGDKLMHVGTVAFDSSYPTGGEAYTAGLFGFDKAPDLIIALPSNGFVFDVDTTNLKIKARGISVAGGAAAAGTDALSLKAGVLSTEAALAQNAGLPQVTSTADLSALTAVPIIAIGSV